MNPEETGRSPMAADTTSGREDLARTGREALDAAHERTGDLRAKAEEAVGMAGEEVRKRTAAAKGRASDELTRTAEGLETAADELEGSPLQQDLLREAAGGLKQISQAVDGKSIAQMTGELSDFARRNPLAYFGGAALAGFALARFARAGHPSHDAVGQKPPQSARMDVASPNIATGPVQTNPRTSTLGGIDNG